MGRFLTRVHIQLLMEFQFEVFAVLVQPKFSPKFLLVN